MLQNNSEIPLYRQLSDTLQEQIREGNYPPGTQLPSERDLAADYGISRLTVRRAIEVLKRAGYVVVYQGRGAFVSRHTDQNAARVFLGGLSERGFPIDQTTSSKLLDTCVMKADQATIEPLGLHPGEEVIRIRRLHNIDDVPAALDTLYLPFPRCRKILMRDVTRQSLHTLLTRHLNLDVHYLRQTLQANMALKFEMEALALSSPAPVAKFHCTFYNTTNHAVGYMIVVYSTEQCALTFTEMVN